MKGGEIVNVGGAGIAGFGREGGEVGGAFGHAVRLAYGSGAWLGSGCREGGLGVTVCAVATRMETAAMEHAFAVIPAGFLVDGGEIRLRDQQDAWFAARHSLRKGRFQTL